MKRIISVLLVAVCIGMAMPAQAQLKWGVKGGVNVAKVTFDDKLLKSDNMAGFFIGPMAEFTIPVVGLGIDGSLLFSQKGIKADNDAVKQYGLDIPVNLKYNIGLGSLLGIYLAAGPDFYFDFKGNENGYDKRRAMVGVNVGAGLKLIKHLQIGFNYNIPLGKSGDVTWKDGVSSVFKADSYKTKTWQISAAYLF
ncbi:porin family protein [Bacteroides nordii]|uniref:porin family protein n=1 Tax=Bacteroides nordii TaxID=291645 RepID=UPI001898BCF2|nr:porin family protein [Bacteroides nordii]